MHFLPSKRQWIPDLTQMRRILEYFQPSSLNITGYAGPLRWDASRPMKEIVNVANVSISEGLAEYLKHPVPSRMFVLDGVSWSDQVAKSANAAIPPNISNGYVAWDVHLWVGKRTIPDYQLERTVAETSFDVTISGDGMPNDLSAYLELFLNTPESKELRQTLENISGCTWDVLISANY